jgi:hypothetical protein
MLGRPVVAEAWDGLRLTPFPILLRNELSRVCAPH